MDFRFGCFINYFEKSQVHGSVGLMQGPGAGDSWRSF